MDRFRLRQLVENLHQILDELESEVYSDPSKYLQDIKRGVSIEDDDGSTD